MGAWRWARATAVPWGLHCEVDRFAQLRAAPRLPGDTTARDNLPSLLAQCQPGVELELEGGRGELPARADLGVRLVAGALSVPIRPAIESARLLEGIHERVVPRARLAHP